MTISDWSQFWNDGITGVYNMYNGEYPDGNVLDTLSGVLCGAVSFRVAEGAAGWVTLQFCAAVGGMDSVGGGNNCDIP